MASGCLAAPPACTAAWASAWGRAEERWLLEACFHLTRSRLGPFMLLSGDTKSLHKGPCWLLRGGHHRGPQCPSWGSPTIPAEHVVLGIVFQLWRAQKPTLPANVTQANLTWTPEARNLLSKDTASAPAAIISVLHGPATSAPHASCRQPVLSTEPKCRGGDTARVPLSAEELCWVSKPLLRYIWLEPLPQLQRGMRRLSQLFPRGESPGKIIIKLILNFSVVSFSVCSEKYPGKTNEILLNISIFCLLSNPNSSCVTACQEASAIMHTLLWQHLKTAEIVWNNQT